MAQALNDPIRAHGVIGIHGIAASGVVRVVAVAQDVVAVLRDRCPAVPEVLAPSASELLRSRR